MLKPIGNNIVIEVLTEEDKTKSGIILSNNKKQMAEAKVKAIGKDVKHVAVGEKVIYCEYAGTRVEDYLILEENDIIAVLEDDNNE